MLEFTSGAFGATTKVALLHKRHGSGKAKSGARGGPLRKPKVHGN